MDTDSRLRRILNRLTDTIVVGVFILAVSLPVVTGFAALRAGAAVLADQARGGSAAGRFAAALRRDFRQSLLLGVIFAAAAGVGTVDILTAMSGRLGIATLPVEAAGLALLLAAAVLPAWTAAAFRSGGPAGPVTLLRCAMLAAAARPSRSAALLGAVLAGTAVSAAAPILAPAALGTLALITSHLPVFALKPTRP